MSFFSPQRLIGTRLNAVAGQVIPNAVLTQLVGFAVGFQVGGNFVSPSGNGIIPPASFPFVNIAAFGEWAFSIGGNRFLQLRIGAVTTPARASKLPNSIIGQGDVQNISWNAVRPANPGIDELTLWAYQDSGVALTILDFQFSANFTR